MVALGSGVPALVFLVWTFGKAATPLIARTREQVDRVRVILLVGVGAMIMGFAVRNVFDYMFGGSLAYVFWIVIAAGFAQGVVFKWDERRQAVL